MEKSGIIALLTQGELDVITLTTVWLPGKTQRQQETESLRAKRK